METKKSKKADLENKRVLFFQIGLIVALGAILAAFEWSEIYSINNEPIEKTYHVSYNEELPPIVRIQSETKTNLRKLTQLVKFEIVKELADLPDDKLEFSPELVTQETPPMDINNMGLKGEDDEPQPFALVEQQPEFPGGIDGLFRFVNKHIKYPIICQELGIQGTVYISFIIDKSGNVTGITLSKSADRNLDKEAMRVIAMMPKWKPGKQRDVPVKVAFSMPVRFSLQN